MPTRASFQTKLFLAAFSTTLLAVVVAGVLFAVSVRQQTNARVEEALTAEARLAASLVSRVGATSAGGAMTLDAEADRIGALISARVTLIAPDGTVVGDSSEPESALPSIDAGRDRDGDLAALRRGCACVQEQCRDERRDCQQAPHHGSTFISTGFSRVATVKSAFVEARSGRSSTCRRPEPTTCRSCRSRMVSSQTTYGPGCRL